MSQRGRRGIPYLFVWQICAVGEPIIRFCADTDSIRFDQWIIPLYILTAEGLQLYKEEIYRKVLNVAKLAKRTQNIGWWGGFQVWSKTTETTSMHYRIKLSQFAFAIVCKNCTLICMEADMSQWLSMKCFKYITHPDVVFVVQFKSQFCSFQKCNQYTSLERYLITGDTHTCTHTYLQQLPSGWKEHNVSISQFFKLSSPGEKTFGHLPLVAP